jgi:hypothetical protein
MQSTGVSSHGRLDIVLPPAGFPFLQRREQRVGETQPIL